MKNNQEGDFQSKNLSKQNVEEQQLEKQKQTLKQTNKELNKGEAKNSSENLAHTLRLDALNLKIDPKNPERKPWRLNGQSVVNGINALDDASSNLVKNSKWTLPITLPLALTLKIIPTIAKATAYTAGGVVNSAKKVGNFFKKDYFKTKPNEYGDWDVQKQDIEKQAKMLGELKETGELLKEIEKNLTKNGALNKAEFAKSAVNILSNKENKDLLESYLKEKGASDKEIKTAITAVNKAKHYLLTGEPDADNIFQPKGDKKEIKKQFIEFLGYKTKGELALMSDTEINKTIAVLEKDFGFTLSDAGTIEYKKPDYQNENYQKELKTANNIYEKLEEKVEGKFDYAVQNKELEEQKAKEEENNKNYSRTSTGETKQSGMSAENMAGNAAVLGGAIASAAVIPFVGWIVALAILYSFKDKFKDNQKAEEDLYKNVAKGLTKNGKNEKEAETIIADLKNEVDQLKKDKHKDQELIKDMSKIIPDDQKLTKELVEEIQQIQEKNKHNNEQFKQGLKKFLEDKKISPESLQKLLDKNLDTAKNQELKKVIEQMQQNETKISDTNEGKGESGTQRIYQSLTKNIPNNSKGSGTNLN